ncbi:DUF5722 domain-containing protein [Gaoshiqia sp. Z1-71]|uniref:DUF5722 domain-containing protein n=1 Tax=Gaoshiqia hydrogeniformans TaxID=3290090 RepID=UPI003BF86013
MKFDHRIPDRAVTYTLFISVLFILFSCKKDLPGEPVTIVKSNYLSLQTSSANQLEINPKGSYQYELTTTGEDPYVSLVPLTSANPSEQLVFTFEYQSNREISDLQIFFGPPISEDRSVKTEALPATSVWRTFSFDAGDEIKKFSWGNSGNFLRLDFGNKSGVLIQIRNMQLRARNAAEEALAKEREDRLANDLLLESNLSKYLSSGFSSQISDVQAGPSNITIRGTFSGEGEISLCEVAPSDQLTQIEKFTNSYPLSESSFAITLDRFVSRNGFRYDRLLSKWVIVKKGTSSDEIISHARYAGQITPNQTMSPQRPSGRKGLGGYAADRGFQTDLDDLHITSATVNVAFTEFMYLQSRSNAITHSYGDKTYYFDRTRVEALDRTMQAARSKNIVVAAIILVQNASQCADPEIGKLLQHPDYTSEGIYTMPNLTTPASVNCYAAALDFLASRYCRSDHAYGRIHHWIMHNEVDAGLSWTNMGDKPMLVYMDTYIKSIRLCYNIARQYDAHSEVFGSFTHSWAEAVGSKYYATKNMLKTLKDYCDAEGDFQWGLACHPYPQDLNEPKTWNDANATFSMNSPLVTFKNLEVLDAWIKKPENKYQGTEKRTLWLSENGTNSRTYRDIDLKEQAAGFAYAWKKLKNLDGIDAFQWHNWIDNRLEDGLRIGLRRFPDDAADPGGRKPVWFAYQAADTGQEDAVFDPYKTLIGIQNWDEVAYVGPIN